MCECKAVLQQATRCKRGVTKFPLSLLLVIPRHVAVIRGNYVIWLELRPFHPLNIDSDAPLWYPVRASLHDELMGRKTVLTHILLSCLKNTNQKEKIRDCCQSLSIISQWQTAQQGQYEVQLQHCACLLPSVWFPWGWSCFSSVFPEL